MLNNGRCDQACNTAACENDGGECDAATADGAFPLVAVWASLGVFLGCVCCVVLPMLCCVLYLRWQRNTIREMNYKANTAMMSSRSNPDMQSARNAASTSGRAQASGTSGGVASVSHASSEPTLYPSQQNSASPRAFVRTMSMYGKSKLGFNVPDAPKSMPGLSNGASSTGEIHIKSQAVTGGFPGRGASKPDF